MDEYDEQYGEEPPGEEPVTERVQIVGAETASVLAAGQAEAENAASNGTTAPEGEREQRYLGFVHDAPPSPPPAPEPLAPPADGSELATVPPELPHWSDPPTGQVPAIIDRRADEPDDPFADSGPVWREHDHEWEDTGFDAALLRDEDEVRGGALDETPSEGRRPWEFDTLAPPAPEVPAGEQGTLDWDDVVRGDPAELDTGKIHTGALSGADAVGAGGGSPSEGPAEYEPQVGVGAGGLSDDEESITGQHRAVGDAWWGEEDGPGTAEPGQAPEETVTELSVGEPTRAVPAPAVADEPVAVEVAAPAEPHRHVRRPDRPARRVAPAEPPPGRRNVPVAIATGVGIAALALVCFKLGTVATLALATVVVTLAAAEAYAALRRSGRRPATLLGLAATIAVMVTAYTKGVAALPLVAMLVLVTAMVWYLVGADRSSAVEGVSATVLGFLWVGVLGSFSALILAPSIYPHRHGVAFLLGAVVATVAADVGALAVGSVIGRHQLAPHVSPNKTWEGWVGGAVLAVVASVFITGHVHPWTPTKAAILGAVIAVVGPVGDLCESLVKRDLGLKDMGSLLPGHGGVLDRVDALLFALPATYYLVRVLNLG